MRWNKIEGLLTTEETTEILSMPIFEPVEEDKLVWDKDKVEIYSVRAGYLNRRTN
jgi:hypothetical protein